MATPQGPFTLTLTNGAEEDLLLCALVDGLITSYPFPPGKVQVINAETAVSITVVPGDSACPV